MNGFVRAVERGRTEQAVELLEGTPQLVQVQRPRSPLWIAAQHGHAELAGALLERGADPNSPDDEPWATPLAWAERRGHTEIVNLLKAYGATF